MNRATRVSVATLGVLLAISGMNHGFFETLQGNIPTDDLIIQAIGQEHQMWFYGGEEAFTIIPNFLLTGILAIAVSSFILIWSLFFVHKRRGPLVFILLFILLFLVGGGIGQIIIFPWAWAASTRINKPLTWWRRILPGPFREVLARLWLPLLIAGSLLFVMGLVIAITGLVPGVTDPERVITIDWSILGLGLGFFLLSFVAGFAHDLQAQNG